MELSSSGETNIPLPNVAVGQLCWTRLEELKDGRAYQHLMKYTTSGLYSKFQDAVTIYERVLFKTSVGDLGFGPLSTQSTDQVWVAENASVPFILRPIQGNSYQLVGECYVSGIMDIQLIAAGGLEFEFLTLV